MVSNEQPEMAQRSEEGRKEWAAEQAGELQGTKAVEEVTLGGGELGEMSGFPSQRMHSKGAHGNQTRSLPVSMYTSILLWPRERERV